MKMSRRLACLVPGCVLASMLAGPAQGDELHVGLRAGGSYSDNVRRVSTDEEGSGAALIGIDLGGRREEGRLLYDLLGDVERQFYMGSDAEDQTYGTLRALTSYGFVPGRFDWRLSGSYDQTRRDLLRPVAPGNLENVITLSTGPQWNVRLGDSFESTLEAHYSTADYSERPFDSSTTGGSVIVGRRLSANSFVGFGASADDISYDEAASSALDFDRREYFLRLNAEGVRTEIELDAGYSEVDGNSFSNSGPMARINVDRRLTPTLSGFAGYTKGFPTSEGAAFTPSRLADLGTDSSVLTGAPRKTESAEIGLDMQANRTDATVSFIRREETRLGVDAQRKFNDVRASFTRAVAPRANVTLFARYTKEDVTNVNADEQVYGLGFNVRLGRLLALNFRAQYRERDSDDAAGSFDETSGGLFLRYGN